MPRRTFRYQRMSRDRLTSQLNTEPRSLRHTLVEASTTRGMMRTIRQRKSRKRRLRVPVKRVEERVKTMRASRQLERFEETNTHQIANNEKGASNRTAVYRWVDKIQRLQEF